MLKTLNTSPSTVWQNPQSKVKLSGVNTQARYEDELLICCARVSPSDEVRERMRQLLHQQLDWQDVLNRSWWHRIRPLTYLHLREQPTGLVPTAFLQELHKHTKELKQRNLRLTSLLDDVAALFEQSSLRLILFKGPTLAADAYGDSFLRECGDLDMLISPEDFPRVKDVLITNGFECSWDQVDSNRKRQLFACEFQRGGLELDVHWDLAPGWHNYQVDFGRLWEDGNPFMPNSRFVRKLRPEDSIEVLCMHGSRHWWERLRWICDIAELVNSGSIQDWNRVESDAVEARCHRSVSLGLWLASDLLGAKLPADIRDSLDRVPVIKRLAAQVAVWLKDPERAAELRRLPDRFLFRMRLCERLRDRIPQLTQYLLALPSRSAH